MQWGSAGLSIVAVLAMVGCGGTATGSEPDDKDETANQGAPGGTTAVSDETTTTTGGTASSNGACPASELFASIGVSQPDGMTPMGTNGKVRVSVTKVEDVDSFYLDAPADVRDRTYHLHGPTQDWVVNATIPGLTNDLIKVGDELDFQLQTSPGQVPLVQVTNKAFGLFNPEGELLLFGAETTSYMPVPDLAFLGLQMSDMGTSCVSPGSGGGCTYNTHGAHFSAPGATLDLQPGHSGQLGGLVVGLEDFRTVVSNAGACDGSGRSVVVGIAGTN